MSGTIITTEAIAAMAARIAPFVRATPVVSVRAADFGLDGLPIAVKLESLQVSGSFKVRGALANLLSRPVPVTGVAAPAGGNHGVGVAYAAQRLGHRARIFIAAETGKAKVSRIRGFGADTVASGGGLAAALEDCLRWASASGAMTVHPFDARETILGQATIGPEWIGDTTRIPFDTVIVAAGGGALAAGLGAWLRGRVRVVAVEPVRAPTLHAAMKARSCVKVETSGLAADTLGIPRAGSLVLPIARRWVDRVVLVTDADLVEAQKRLWSALRVAAEPAGAAPLAALLARAYVPGKSERVGLLIGGGNDPCVSFGG